MLLCAAADLVSFMQLFSSFLYDNLSLRFIAIFAMLMAFEIAPIYLGYTMKKREQGYNIRDFLTIGFVASFVMAAVVNVVLRIITKDLAFPDFSNLAASSSALGSATMAGTRSNALYYASAFAVLPIITSVVSFLASFTMANPLRDEMKKLEHEHVKIAESIGQIQAILKEYDADLEHFDRLLIDDSNKYGAAFAMIQKKRELYFDYVRELFNEYLKDSTEIGRPIKKPEVKKEDE